MSEEATAKSTFDGVLKTIADAFNRFATVEVRTVVANIDVVIKRDGDNPLEIDLINLPADPDAPNTEKALYTAINQATGDINTVWGSGFDPVADAVLFETHKDNVVLSKEIFANNLAMVGDLIDRFTRR